jgi:hypothetical protein
MAGCQPWDLPPSDEVGHLRPVRSGGRQRRPVKARRRTTGSCTGGQTNRQREIVAVDGDPIPRLELARASRSATWVNSLELAPQAGLGTAGAGAQRGGASRWIAWGAISRTPAKMARRTGRFPQLVDRRSSVNGLLLTGSPRFREVSPEERRSLCRLISLRAADAHPPAAYPRQLRRSTSCSMGLLRLDSSRDFRTSTVVAELTR